MQPLSHLSWVRLQGESSSFLFQHSSEVGVGGLYSGESLADESIWVGKHFCPLGGPLCRHALCMEVSFAHNSDLNTTPGCGLFLPGLTLPSPSILLPEIICQIELSVNLLVGSCTVVKESELRQWSSRGK